MSDCSASARTDAHEDARQLVPDILRRPLVVHPPFDFRNDLVAVSRQRARRLVDELGPIERRHERIHELVFGSDGRRSDGLPRDLLVSVADERREQIGERAGHEGHQARRFRPLSRAVGSRHADHGLEEPSRGIQVLRRTRRRQKRSHPGADREVLEVAELLNLRERIDAHLARQVQERFRPNAEVGILEQFDRP